MAGPNKGNVIEYVFQGNIYDLEKSMELAKKLMAESVTVFAKAQGKRKNALAKEQKDTIKQIDLIRTQLEQAYERDPHGKEKPTKELFKYYMKLVTQFNQDALRANAKRIKEESKQQRQQAARDKKAADARNKELDFAKTPAGQEQARVQSEYLSASLKQVGMAMSAPAIQDITNALANYKAVMESTTATEQEKAEAVVNLNDKFRQYDATIRRLKNTVITASKGIKSLSDVINQVKVRIDLAIKSASFWIQILRRVIQLIKQGIQNFSDYVESLNFLRQAADEAADSMTAFTKSQYLAFGLDPKQVNQSTAMFYSFADSMGFTGDQLELVSQNMSKLAQDIASLQNIDLDIATTKLRSALSGYSRALAQLGVNVTDTNLNEWLLSKGINKSMDSMNEASQAAARYAFILEKTQSAQGDLAKTITSPANQLKILKNQFNLLMQNVGALITQVLVPLVRVLNMLLRPINSLLTAMTSAVAESFSTSIGNANDDMSDLVDTTNEEADAIKGLAGIDEINQKTEAKVESTGGIDEDIASMLHDYDNLAGTLEPIIAIFDRIGQALEPIFSSLSILMAPILEFVQSVLNLVGKLLDPLQGVFDFIGKIFTILTPISNFIGTVLEWVVSVIDTIISDLRILIPLIVAVVALLAATHWTGFLSALSKMIIGFHNLTTAIAGAIKNLVIWLAQTIKSIAMNIKNAISAWIAAGAYWKLAVAILATLGVAAIAVTAIVLTATNAAESKANSATGSEPHLARGGIVTQPTMALVGEGNYNEAVIPLGNSPQFESMKESIAEKVVMRSSIPSISGTSGSSQPIILNIDGRTLARALWPRLAETYNQVGVNLK